MGSWEGLPAQLHAPLLSALARSPAALDQLNTAWHDADADESEG